MQVAIQQQNVLLQQIGSKLNICQGPNIIAQDLISTDTVNPVMAAATGSTAPDDLSGHMSLYDNFGVHQRGRSVRRPVEHTDRPRSLLI